MGDYGMTLADGSEWTIPAAAQAVDYPSSINFRDIFGTVREITDFALQTQSQFASIQNASETTDFNRFMQSLQLDTAKTLAQSQAETEKVKAQAILAAAQGKAAVASGTVSQPGRYDTIFVLAAIVGVIGVVYQLAKGK